MDLPLFAAVDSAALGLAPPSPRHGLAVRAWVRSLAGMQKEALVATTLGGHAWRLTSDEGPYLAGHDRAPCPLAFMTAGMAASYLDEIVDLFVTRAVTVDDLRLTLDNRYTMEGSALRGTMVGGALDPALHVELEAADNARHLRELVELAVRRAPVNGLLRGVHRSRFTLAVNGRHVPVGRVDSLGGQPEPDPLRRFGSLVDHVVGPGGESIVRLTPAEEVHDAPGGVGSSLKAEQSRTLHVRGVCTRRPDGVKEIEQDLLAPIGSTFRFLSDEPAGHGGQGRAPDAATYLAAGIAFCFMTQCGRYAAIVRKQLDAYRVVQELHLSSPHATDGPTADPVETHVHLDTPEGEAFGRDVLDMGEQTCFLHAACRSQLDTEVSVSGRPVAR